MSMRRWNLLRWVRLVAFAAAFGLTLAYAQPVSPRVTPADVLDWRWRLAAADEALHAGLPGMADGLYAEVLRSSEAKPIHDAVRLKRVSALIALNRLAEAAALLDSVQSRGPAYRLRLALVALANGRDEALGELLSPIRRSELSEWEKPWWSLLQGCAAQADGRFGEARSFFEDALADAVSASQRGTFEAFIFQRKLRSVTTDATTLSVLRQRAAENRGTRAGFDFARQLAVVLDQRGERDAALKVLQDQRALLRPQETEEIAQLGLLTGQIADPATRRGQLALQEVLRLPEATVSKQLALHMLTAGMARSADESVRQGYQEILEEIAAQRSETVRDAALLGLARWSLQQGERAKAVSLAETLLRDLPASPLAVEARWLLAVCAWQSGAFRRAADQLGQIRQASPDDSFVRRVSELMGDSYFANGDFATAADVYRSVLPIPPSPSDGSVLFQLVAAQLELGRLEEASAVLDKIAAATDALPFLYWQAEWNLIHALRRAGAIERAAERINAKVGDRGFVFLPLDLRLKFRWLQGQLAYEEQDDAAVPAITELILETADAQRQRLETGFRATLISHTLFLRGKALIRQGANSLGREAFERLREDFSTMDPALLSYIEEARFLAARGSLREARASLQRLAQRYPESRYAPLALYEAALLAGQQGRNQQLEEGLAQLKALIETYPEHPLVFHARVLQGDFARMLGRFSIAQEVYRSILQDFPDHPQRHLAQLYIANVLLARSDTTKEAFEEAALRLERLRDNPEIPLDTRVEAALVMGLCLFAAERDERAAEQLWLALSRFLLEPAEAGKLGPKGRYWAARMAMRLAEYQENVGQFDEAARLRGMIETLALPETAAAQNEKDAEETG